MKEYHAELDSKSSKEMSSASPEFEDQIVSLRYKHYQQRIMQRVNDLIEVRNKLRGRMGRNSMLGSKSVSKIGMLSTHGASSALFQVYPGSAQNVNFKINQLHESVKKGSHTPFNMKSLPKVKGKLSQGNIPNPDLVSEKPTLQNRVNYRASSATLMPEVISINDHGQSMMLADMSKMSAHSRLPMSQTVAQLPTIKQGVSLNKIRNQKRKQMNVIQANLQRV